MKSIEIHETLNPKIWNSDDTLREDVKDKLNEIVDEFIDSLEIPLTIIDAHIVGSNASFNYTEHSDLDLHCIVNFSRIDADPAIIESWLWSEKKIFNDEYDITIRGIEVELYVEDVKSNVQSNGIYSLFNEEWIKFPEPIEAEIDDEAVEAEVEALIPEIEQVLQSKDSNEIGDMIDKLYLIRKNGLSVDGEYGIGNQVFKTLRNEGYLDELKNKLADLRSDELSIFGSKSTWSSFDVDNAYIRETEKAYRLPLGFKGDKKPRTYAWLPKYGAKRTYRGSTYSTFDILDDLLNSKVGDTSASIFTIN